MQRNQRIQATAHHLRRIYQSGIAVAMRVGAIKRNHAAALAKIGATVGNSWFEAERIAQAMALTPPLALVVAQVSETQAGYMTAPMMFAGHDGGDDGWIESARASMAGRAARSASVRLIKRAGLVPLAGLCLVWLVGASK